MARYTVKLSRKANSYYKRVGAKTAERLKECFETLEQTPKDWQHPQIKPLRGRLSGLWRYRVGDLRIIYQIKADVRIVYVVNIGPRGDIY